MTVAAAVSSEKGSLHHALRNPAWEKSFDRKTLYRGKAYAADGLATLDDWEWSELGELSVEGRVRGAALYETKVSALLRHGQLFVDGDCSCPVGIDCKHAVALMEVLKQKIDEEASRQAASRARKVLSRSRDDRDSRFSHWLHTSLPPENKASAPPSKPLGASGKEKTCFYSWFLGQGDEDRGGMLHVQVLAAHWLKSERWSAITLLKFGRMDKRITPTELSEEDEQLCLQY
ncbi:MAG: SWIM zinc finger family protein [Verrucomicrobiota bacterium]